MSDPGFSEIFAKLTAEATAAADRQHNGSRAGREALGLADPIAGTGTAADDRITATVVDGTLTSCDIQPLAARLDNVELGEQVCAAVNAALAAYQAALAEAMAAQRIDLGGVSESLQQIQAETQAAMNSSMDTMLQMLRSVKERE